MELLWFLEGLRSPALEAIFLQITRFGEELVLILVFCIIFWCINKHMAYVLGFSFFISSLLVQGLKIIFRVPRPWVTHPEFTPVQGAISEATGYSFPSGHTQNAAALLGSLGVQIKQKIVKIILFIIVLLVGFSRLVLGVHYLSDVLTSLIISFVVIFIAMKVISSEVVSRKRELIISLIIIALATVVLIIAAVLYHQGITTTQQVRDAVISAGSSLGFAVGMFIERNYIRFSVKTKNIPLQLLKIVIGLAGVIGFQEGLRVIGSGLIADAIRYFLIVIWIMVLYPLIIKRFIQVKNEK